jgi:hypothetical protein
VSIQALANATLKIARELEYAELVDGPKNKGIRTFHRAADASTIAARTASGAYVVTQTAPDGSTIAVVEIKAKADLDELRGRLALQAQALDVISTPVRVQLPPTALAFATLDLSAAGLRRRYFGPEAPVGTVDRTGYRDPKPLSWFIARRAVGFEAAGHDGPTARGLAVSALEADYATGSLPRGGYAKRVAA